MIDHLGLSVSDYERAKEFYLKALAPLGVGLIMEVAPEQTEEGFRACGLGSEGKPYFWIAEGGKVEPHLHIAFEAEKRRDVDAFYNAALAAGAKDNGPPGIRADYHPNYYGAFVLDLDGHNVEAVCHTPE